MIPRTRTVSLFAGALALLATSVRPAPGAAAAAEAPLKDLGADAGFVQVPAGATGSFDVARSAPAVRFGVLPGQYDGAELWSSWGDAVLASDGCFYTSIGDHDKPYGSAFIYKVDAERGTMRQVVNVNEVLGLTNSASYAPGKIHAPLVDGGDGWLYAVTYRGGAAADFRGDWLLRYELAGGRAESLGIMVPECSVPSMIYHAPSRMLYGLSVPGTNRKEPAPAFFAYSLEARKVVFSCPSLSGPSRACFADAAGNVYWDSDKRLGRYDVAAKKAAAPGAAIPGNGTLRAASAVSSKGIAYGITSDGVVFAYDTKGGSIREIGKVFPSGGPYTAVCRLDPTERFLYYVPAAHGGTSKTGTAVVQLSLETGRPKVIAFMAEPLARLAGYSVGGTYGLALSADGSRLFIAWNGGRPGGKSKDFGLCAVTILDIPAGER